MRFPVFVETSGREFAVNPAFVSRVAPHPTDVLVTLVTVMDRYNEDGAGYPLPFVGPEVVAVDAPFQKVLDRLNYALRQEVEILG